MNTYVESHERRSVSLFWPIVLIGAGIVLLLGNAGRLTQDPLELLVQYWPVIFILIGVDVLFSRTGWIGAVVSGLLGVVVVAGAIAYLTAPGNTFVMLSWQRLFDGRLFDSALLRTEQITQPLDGVRSASVELRFPAGKGQITATSASSNLVEGDARYYGNLINEVAREGDTATVKLLGGSALFGWFNFGANQPRWNLRLNPRVRYDLDITTGSGEYDFDLSEFEVRSVALNQGSGETTMQLPEGGQYHVALVVNSGNVRVNVPRGTPVRVHYQLHSGSLNVGDTRRINGSGMAGTYESPDFTSDGASITFDVEISSGDVAIR
jgi:hypothetical protein